MFVGTGLTAITLAARKGFGEVVQLLESAESKEKDE